jgi:hypothetical protein
MSDQKLIDDLTEDNILTILNNGKILMEISDSAWIEGPITESKLLAALDSIEMCIKNQIFDIKSAISRGGK